MQLNRKYLTAFFVAAVMLFAVGVANAQKAYTYVQQDNEKLDKLGTAAYDLSPNSHPTVEFVNGKAIMTIGTKTVAGLPMAEKGQLVVDFETALTGAELNKVTKECTYEFATLYSPFQLVVPESTVKAYAPSYDADEHVLKCNSSTFVTPGEILPIETALLLKNKGTAEFIISADASTTSPESALSGSSLNLSSVTVPEDNTLFTLGHALDEPDRYGFFKYIGEGFKYGLTWLIAPSVQETPSGTKYIAISFDDEVTGISSVNNEQQTVNNGKFLENNRVVIVKNGKKFNINGQEIK